MPRSHAEIYHHHPRIELRGICDLRQEILEAFRETWADVWPDIRTYTDYREMLEAEEPDIVSVCTWHLLHPAPTIAAAKGGAKAVICEKPMAISSKEGERMRAVCDDAGVRLMICFYQRFNARHCKIKQLLIDGAIGQVTAVRVNFSGRSPDDPFRWRHDPVQAGGGSYMDNASHSIDLLRFLFGEITEVTAFVDPLAARYEVEDTASSILRLSNGAHAVVTSHWSTGDPDESRNALLEIQGTAGTIISAPLHDKFSRGTLTVDMHQESDVYEFERSTHHEVLEDFAVTIAEDRLPTITASDGIAAMRVVEAVYESSRRGCVVPMN